MRELVYHNRCNRCGVTTTTIEGMTAHQEDMNHTEWGWDTVENEQMLSEPAIVLSGKQGIAFYLERCMN